MKPYTNGFARRYHPISLQSDTRDWFDCALHPDVHSGGGARCATAADFAALGMPNYTGTNGDFIAQDHEIGTVGTNATPFTSGEFAAVGTRPDPDLQREYNIEWSGSVQHEIAPRVSLTAAWYRRVFYDIENAQNLALRSCDVSTAVAGVPCGDWIPFNVTFDDPGGRLGYLNGIGQAPTLAGTSFLAFNQDPATRTLKDIVHVNSDINRNYYNGLELSLQARLPNGGTVFGGWTMHQHVQDTCGLTTNPNGQVERDMIDRNRTTLRGGRFCDQSALGIPFRHDFKMFGAYPLPGDFEFSGSIQAYSGNEREMRWTVTDAYYPGGDLTDNQSVQLFVPGTNYFGYWTQVDLALRKIFRIGTYEYSAQLDILQRAQRGRHHRRERLLRLGLRDADAAAAGPPGARGVPGEVVDTGLHVELSGFSSGRWGRSPPAVFLRSDESVPSRRAATATVAAASRRVGSATRYDGPCDQAAVPGTQPKWPRRNPSSSSRTRTTGLRRRTSATNCWTESCS